MRSRPPYVLEATLEQPIVATAIHAGHDLRREVARRMLLDPDVRLREEDPYVDGWTTLAPNRICVRRSRFEVDMNRSMEDAVCFVPETCWDLQVWRGEIPPRMHARSLQIHE